MRIYPAIDLRHGQCVRLIQGEADRETVYSDNPLDVALSFADDGADWVHIVDLDAAFDGTRHHTDIVAKIAAQTPLRIQLGGGIRTLEDIDACLSAGVSRVVIGTAAHNNPPLLAQAVKTYGGNAIAVGIDARNSRVALAGWTHQTDTPVLSLAQRAQDAGVSTIIYTDIATDGMLSGPDIATLESLLSHISCHIIASGGIGALTHIADLLTVQPHPPEGCIIGKALYDKRITLKDALTAAAADMSAENRS